MLKVLWKKIEQNKGIRDARCQSGGHDRPQLESDI